MNGDNVPVFAVRGTLDSSPTKTPLAKDAIADEVQPSFDSSFALLHSECKTILSATGVSSSWRVLRSEFTTRNCLFQEVTWEQLKTKLAAFPSVLTREQVNEKQELLLEDFLDFVGKIKRNENGVASEFGSFLTTAGNRFQPHYRPPGFLPTNIVGCRGPLARRTPDGGIDEAAGFYCHPDHLLSFGSERRLDEPLMATEFKQFDFRPSMDPWYAQDDHVFVQLLASMIGNLAPIGLALSNYGMKVLLMEIPLFSELPTKCSIWHDAPQLMSFTNPAHLEMAFEFFLEIIRLSVRPAAPPIQPVSKAARFVQVAGMLEEMLKTEAEGLREAKRRRTAKRKEDKRLALQTAHGKLIDVWSLAMEHQLSPEVLRELARQAESEKREMERKKDLDDERDSTEPED